jgi:acyl-CoA dehydrogenase
MFLVGTHQPGFHVTRRIGSLDESFVGGHAEVAMDGCHVTDDAVLGEVGRGFTYAQVRLGPARLSYCMRWLGIARRAHDLALDRASPRCSWPRRLAGWSTGPCRSAAALASPTTCPWPGSCGRCAPFRIYDGPSETHRWSLGRRALRRRVAERAAQPPPDDAGPVSG